jgi:DNA modification methylase
MEVNQIIHGDCLQVLYTFPSNIVDSVVTDPPYGLSREPNIREVLEKWLAGEDYTHRGSGFMGKTWDSFVPGPSIWREVYRVLKPGGHALVFAGTRTQDLMTVSLRMAGFEVRDVIAWLYFNGFPKSLDVSKAFDKAGGSRWASREFSRRYAKIVRNSPYTHSDIDRMLGIKSSSCYWAREDYRGGIPPRHHWEKLCEILPIPDDFKRFYDEAEREKIGKGNAGLAKGESRRNRSHVVGYKETYYITAPATDLAKKWDGWGTALKPAHEPIIVARKPLDGTVADNVERWGTGALNIDRCRIGESGARNNGNKPREDGYVKNNVYGKYKPMERIDYGKGRFPTNCVTVEDDQFYSKYFNITPPELSKKAPKKDRNSDWRGEEIDITNRHPTVKPTDLMAWLVRLITPPGGVVLDPFAGSGSTCVAARREGFFFIGIERELEYVEIARKRVGEIKAVPS